MKHSWWKVALCLLVGVCGARSVSLAENNNYRHELKRLKKEGWQVQQGLSLEQQLEHYYSLLLSEDDQHAPRYVVGKATGVGNSYTSALHIATANARADLINNISVRVEARVETNISSGTSIDAYRQLIAAERLVEATAELTLFRTNSQHKTEVCTYILYPWEKVVQWMSEATETNE